MTEVPTRARRAFIDEDACIGCTKCIQACPVDAIVGAPRRMHTVIEHQCTGCELCLPPCPVDCITLVPLPPERVPAPGGAAAREAAAHDRARAEARAARLARAEDPRLRPASPPRPDPAERRRLIAEAVARARARRAGR